MSKVRREGDLLYFKCPACMKSNVEWGDGELHPAPQEHCVNVGKDGWGFNGSLEKPTLTPSVRVRYGEIIRYTCHFFVRNGKIEYCTDCTHSLAGKTVDMV